MVHFTGQEIRIEPGSFGDYSTATLLAGRLVQQLAQHGPLTQTEEVMAPDGSQMRLSPMENSCASGATEPFLAQGPPIMTRL